MDDKIDGASIEVFSTCPPSAAADRGRYLQHVIDVARWSEEAGCQGILVYSDNSLVDPWLLAHIIVALLIEDHAAEALDSPPSALGYAA